MLLLLSDSASVTTATHHKMSNPHNPTLPHTKTTTDIITDVTKWQEQLHMPTYSWSIRPLLDLQRQIQHPFFPHAYPPPSTIYLHKQQLYLRLHTLYLAMKNQTLSTFYTRIRCPRCHQLPVRDHPYHSTSLQDLNHSLPREASTLWRTLRREMEGVDLLQLRQGHLDQVLEGLWEVERLFLEGDQGGCGVEVWNGGRGGPALG
jgi:hypothetical protein